MHKTLTNTLRSLDLYGVGIQNPAAREFVTRTKDGAYIVTDGWQFGHQLGRTVAESRAELRRIANHRATVGR